MPDPAKIQSDTTRPLAAVTFRICLTSLVRAWIRECMAIMDILLLATSG